MGFDVLYLPPIHPIGLTQRKGRNNTDDAVVRRHRQPVGDRWAATAATPRSTPSWAPSTTWSRSWPRPTDRGIELALDIAFQCTPGPPVGHRAPVLVRAPPRRHDPVRREPAQEVPGHLPARLRERGLAGPVGGARRRLPLLDRHGRHDVPRRQPAHQGVRLLGVGDPDDPRRDPGGHLPGRGVHPAHA